MPTDAGDHDALTSRFDTACTTVVAGGIPFTIWHPRDAEVLISEDDFARDERLPYWADLWPSAVALAGLVARSDGRGRRFLELGCGSGLVSAAALRVGFDVTATDYYADALAFARLNGLENAGRPPETRLLDFRHPPGDIGRFEVVAAADVLYERPYGPLVAVAIGAALAAGGTAWIADPGRIGASGFLEALPAAGLRLLEREPVPAELAGRSHQVTIYVVGRAD
jgi:predicted nicotinamide N-methyase